MYKYIFKIDGMKCGMCESHVNDAVRKTVKVKKVKSSHVGGTTEIICENILDVNALRDALAALGYRTLSVKTEAYEKKGLFSLFKK